MDGERFVHADSERSNLDRLIWAANNALYDLNAALADVSELSPMQAQDVQLLCHQTDRSHHIASFKKRRLPQS